MAGHTEETPVLTRAAFERLTAELEELTTEGRKGVAQRLQRARELGDLRENAEYDETKNEQGMLEARIRTIQAMLRRARVLDSPVQSEEVVPGILVRVRDAGDPDGEPDTYLVASTTEERFPGARTVSTKSPLGQALLGKRVGDTVTYEAPGGAFSYLIVSLEPAAE